MKWLKTYPDRCIGCGQCMETCSQLWFKEKSEFLARIRVSDQGVGYSINACNQCGKCIDICPVGALTRDSRGVVQLNNAQCVGCMMCVGFCPTSSLFFNASKTAEPFKCVACGACTRGCPTQALEIIEE